MGPNGKRYVYDSVQGASDRGPACGIIGALLCAIIALPVAIAAVSARVIPPAAVGVHVLFGSPAPEPLTPGLHFVNPFAAVHLFDTRTLLFEQTNHVPTKEGVTVELDVALLFHVKPKAVPSVYQNLGKDYVKVIVAPELASAVRGLTSESDASALYTSGRAEMQTRLHKELEATLSPRGIAVEGVLLKGVVLPSLLTDSIDKKAQAEQEAARMQYVIARERQEAERKRIEAAGIADFQRIVSEGISPETLMWKGIEVTHEIATSPNAKIVMIGNSKDSLPIILSDGHGLGHDGRTSAGRGRDGPLPPNGRRGAAGAAARGTGGERASTVPAPRSYGVVKSSTVDDAVSS